MPPTASSVGLPYLYRNRDPRRPLIDLSPHASFEYYHKGFLGVEVLRLVDPERTPEGLITSQIRTDLEERLGLVEGKGLKYLPTENKLRVLLANLQEVYHRLAHADGRKAETRKWKRHAFITTSSGKNHVDEVRAYFMPGGKLLPFERSSPHDLLVLSLEPVNRVHRDPDYLAAKAYYKLLAHPVAPRSN